MPIYVYQTTGDSDGCKVCRSGFEHLQQMNDPALTVCPACGGGIRRVFAPFNVGNSPASLDSRAKAQGFHKLKKVDKGTYEKLY